MAATRNATEVTTIQSIRNLEHRDAEGNIISEMVAIHSMHRRWLIPSQPTLIDQILQDRVWNGPWTRSGLSKRL